MDRRVRTTTMPVRVVVLKTWTRMQADINAIVDRVGCMVSVGTVPEHMNAWLVDDDDMDVPMPRTFNDNWINTAYERMINSHLNDGVEYYKAEQEAMEARLEGQYQRWASEQDEEAADDELWDRLFNKHRLVGNTFASYMGC